MIALKKKENMSELISIFLLIHQFPILRDLEGALEGHRPTRKVQKDNFDEGRKTHEILLQKHETGHLSKFSLLHVFEYT